MVFANFFLPVYVNVIIPFQLPSPVLQNRERAQDQKWTFLPKSSWHVHQQRDRLNGQIRIRNSSHTNGVQYEVLTSYYAGNIYEACMQKHPEHLYKCTSIHQLQPLIPDGFLEETQAQGDHVTSQGPGWQFQTHNVLAVRWQC